jgi:hypothetical protein
MIAMKQGTLGREAGVSNLLFGVYSILVALLGVTLAYKGGALVTAGGSPYYAMMGTSLLISAGSHRPETVPRHLPLWHSLSGHLCLGDLGVRVRWLGFHSTLSLAGGYQRSVSGFLALSAS